MPTLDDTLDNIDTLVGDADHTGIEQAIVILHQLTSMEPGSNAHTTSILLLRDYRILAQTIAEGTDDPASSKQLIKRVRQHRDNIRRDLKLRPGRGPLAQPAPDRAHAPSAGRQLEKIIGANRLMPLAWMKRGLDVARSVGRICTPGGFGTGFLTTGGWLVTNHHVLPTADDVSKAVLNMNFEDQLDGLPTEPVSYRLDPRTYSGSPDFDCIRVRVLETGPPSQSWGVCAFSPQAARVGDFVSIIQHPLGGTKKVALSENHVVNIYEHRIQYVTDTLPGSSGSPVFNDKWEVVGVHHAGGTLPMDAHGRVAFVNEAIVAADVRAALRLP